MNKIFDKLTNYNGNGTKYGHFYMRVCLLITMVNNLNIKTDIYLKKNKTYGCFFKGILRNAPYLIQ